jgi:hypothetical protein
LSVETVENPSVEKTEIMEADKDLCLLQSKDLLICMNGAFYDYTFSRGKFGFVEYDSIMHFKSFYFGEIRYDSIRFIKMNFNENFDVLDACLFAIETNIAKSKYRYNKKFYQGILIDIMTKKFSKYDCNVRITSNQPFCGLSSRFEIFVDSSTCDYWKGGGRGIKFRKSGLLD